MNRPLELEPTSLVLHKHLRLLRAWMLSLGRSLNQDSGLVQGWAQVWGLGLVQVLDSDRGQVLVWGWGRGQDQGQE